ncbi:hypothetical protein EDB84DRAFT_1438713 [Lactarius hengduanensis]|nr:hypothetical protein EDB84DRAFT_1438713 [Lactarius hengduanensis]
MADSDIQVWCLAIDDHYNPIFGEPFPVSVRQDDTIHDLKIKILETPHSADFVVFTNSIQIWKCKSLKLSARDSFGQTTKQVSDLRFSDEEDSPVQHLGAARRMMELQLQDSEILLALVPPSDQVDSSQTLSCCLPVCALAAYSYASTGKAIPTIDMPVATPALGSFFGFPTGPSGTSRDIYSSATSGALLKKVHVALFQINFLPSESSPCAQERRDSPPYIMSKRRHAWAMWRTDALPLRRTRYKDYSVPNTGSGLTQAAGYAWQCCQLVTSVELAARNVGPLQQ